MLRLHRKYGVERSGFFSEFWTNFQRHDWNQLEVTVKELLYETKVKYTQTYWLKIVVSGCTQQAWRHLKCWSTVREVGTTRWQTKSILANSLTLHTKHVYAKPETDTICNLSHELHGCKHRAIAAYGSQRQPDYHYGWFSIILPWYALVSWVAQAKVKLTACFISP
jgi:hypothetical protein